MLRSSTNCIFFLLTLLILTSTNVFSDCDYGQKCYNTYTSWCCPYDEACGSSVGDCNDSNLSPAIIAVIIVFSVFFFVICLTCCIHSQQRQRQLRTAYANSNTRVLTNPYQQSIVQRPVRVVHVRPVYNIEVAPPSRSYPSIYEAPPPSYEVATAALPTIHQSSPSPPVTTTVQQSI